MVCSRSRPKIRLSEYQDAFLFNRGTDINTPFKKYTSRWDTISEASLFADIPPAEVQGDVLGVDDSLDEAKPLG